MKTNIRLDYDIAEIDSVAPLLLGADQIDFTFELPETRSLVFRADW